MVLLPSLRTRLTSSPIDGVRSFERHMGILASTRNRRPAPPGRWIMVPQGDVTAPVRRRGRVIRRRRRNFERLVAAAAITFILGFVPSLRWVWFLHLAVDGALGFYVTRLLRWKHDEQERGRAVATTATTAPEPAAFEPSAPEASQADADAPTQEHPVVEAGRASN